MFLRMVRGAFSGQKKKMLMIAFTIALGASLATAMLNVMMDVGDKVNQELKAYGANITVVPKSTSVISDLYEVEGELSQGAYLKEEDLGKIKTIFWAFNIVDFAPLIDTGVTLAGGKTASLYGSWFNHHLALPTGEELDTGLQNLRAWWTLTEGGWLDEQTMEDNNACMVGTVLAKSENISVGDTITLTGATTAVRTIAVEVIDGHQKIALFASAPHPDIAALRQAIENNPNYELEVLDKADLSSRKLNEYSLLIFHNLPDGRTTLPPAALQLPTLFIVGTQTDLSRFNALHSGGICSSRWAASSS